MSRLKRSICVGRTKEIKPGDLLVWKKNKHSAINNAVLFGIRLLTQSEFAHVAVVIAVENDTVTILEATIPDVHTTDIEKDDEFYHVPVDVVWTDKLTQFVNDVRGCPYSLLDCINAYIGRTTNKDDHWQCAELANAFYKLAGYDLEDNLTPTEVVNCFLDKFECVLNLVKT